MRRIYEHAGFIVDVETRTDSRFPKLGERPSLVGYFALVRLRKKGVDVATFSAVRLGSVAGLSFGSEADAVTGGFGAACSVIDEQFGEPD